MKELVLRLVQALVDSPEQADVRVEDHGGGATLRLEVAETDKGKIIGKQGRVIKAIRSLAGAAAGKAGKKVSVEID